MEISPTTLAIIVALTAAFSSLAGVLITSIFNALNTRSAQKSEERRHHRELIIKAAIENWKEVNEVLKASQRKGAIPPLDDYILHMLKFSELVLDENLESSNIEKKLIELREFNSKIIEYRKKYDPYFPQQRA
jgi:hypothetical protein